MLPKSSRFDALIDDPVKVQIETAVRSIPISAFLVTNVPSHNPHLLERPDLVDPALDFEGFSWRVFGGLLKQRRYACERRSEHRAAL
jgi:hypothetical protein